MPFGIPCPDTDFADVLKGLTVNNNILQAVVYDVVYPIGSGITLVEKSLKFTLNQLKKKLAKEVNANAAPITSAIEAIGTEIGNRLNANALDLAQAQAAITQLPQQETPDIPASDIRRPAWPHIEQDSALIIEGIHRQANNDNWELLQLLYLLGITPSQVRRYLSHGTIPDVWLCPNPAAHDSITLSPHPDVDASGFWSD